MKNSSLKLSSDKSLLLRAPFLKALEGEAMARMLSAMEVFEVHSRKLILEEGEKADHFYCVLRGYIRLYRLNRSGREADIRIAGPGDTFGECLIYGEQKYGYNAQAAENARLARFDIRAVRQLAEEEPAVAKALMASLSIHLLETMVCVANDRLFTAPQRLAGYLLEQCPVDDGPAVVRLPFQKNLLAGMLGLAPEALSRAFSSLRRAGVTVRGRVVQIENVEVLREI